MYYLATIKMFISTASHTMMASQPLVHCHQHLKTIKSNPSLSPPAHHTTARRFIQCKATKNDKSSSSTSSSKDVKINLFETIGTPQDRSSFEPFSQPAPADNPIAALLSTVDFSEPMSFDGEEKTEYDPLRDGPLRYLGYANEVGEAFAAWLFNGGVPLSYAVAIGYVLFDTVDKYNKTLEDARQKLSARKLPADVDLDK